MHAPRASFFTTHRRTILALLFGLAFSATLAYAVPPATQYIPGETLDPTCIPGSANCSVDISGGTFVWGAITGTLSDQTDLQNALDDKFDDPAGTTAQYIQGDGSLGTTAITIENTSSLFSTGLSLTGANSTATDAVFLGSLAGGDAFGANDSVFIGYAAGASAATATNAIFIGREAGNGDTVDNTSFGQTSILLGAYTNTGGFSNSILLGGGTSGAPIANTKANQFMLADTITDVRWSGVEYTLPTAQAGASGYVLTNDGAGVLSWAAGGGGGAQNLQQVTDVGSVTTNGIDAASFAASTGTFTGFDPSGSVNFLNATGDIFGFRNNTNTRFANLNTANIATTDKTFTFPNASGTFALSVNGNTPNSAGDITISIGGLGLETNGVVNGSQVLLNLVAGAGITLADDGIGGVTIDADTIYTADGTISGSRTIDLGGNDFNIVDTGGGNKVGVYIDTAGSISNFGSNPTDGFAYVQVNNDVNDITLSGIDILLNGNIVIAAGASDGYVLTSDGSGNATWQAAIDSPITIENTTSLFSTGLTGTGSSSVATHSLFLLTNAGFNATNAANSIFLGQSAGSGATNAANSIFLGQNAGSGSTINNVGDANDYSILIGKDSSNGNFKNSIAIGMGATNTAANQLVVGSSTRPVSSVFIGGGQGTAATTGTVFIGSSAGTDASSASGSLFIGAATGSQATNASNSQFIGGGAGFQATNATSSVFIGANAGFAAANSSRSVFIGLQAGLRDAANNFGSANTPNSIFIGYYAGALSTDIALDNTGAYNDISTFANTSIVVGHRASTGGFSNSIAIGAYALNTAANQFMIGSTTRPIDTTRINGSTSTQCTITTGTGIACTSDERLKTDVIDLPTSTLDTLLNVRTVTYNWLANPDSPQQIGFLAQDLEQYFPQLVATDSDGYKSVYYAQMTPILVEAIREINQKIVGIGDLEQSNSWRDALTSWFASAGNGIGKLFAGEITTQTLCVADESGAKTCLSKGQLDSVLNNLNTIGPGTTTIVMPIPDVVEEEPEISTPDPEQPPMDPEAETPAEIPTEPPPSDPFRTSP